MKNTIKINGINITIEGNPVCLENIELTSEVSAQELATSGGLIKGLINELKPYIDMAIQANNKPATPVTTTAPARVVTGVPAPKQIPSNDGIIHAKEPKGSFSLTKAFTEMPIPENIESVSYMKYRFKNEQSEITVDASEYNCIHIHVYAMKKWMHVHVHPNNASFVGSDIKPEEMDDFLGASGIPVEIQEDVKKVVTL